MATTQDVFDHHVQGFVARDVDTVLEDYTDDSIVIANGEPDGTLVVTVGENTARVWRVGESGESIDLEGDYGNVVAAAFSPAGTQVVTALEDGTPATSTPSLAPQSGDRF